MHLASEYAPLCQQAAYQRSSPAACEATLQRQRIEARCRIYAVISRPDVQVINQLCHFPPPSV